MFDPRPLCYSSLTTAVGGTTYTNFVDSAHPTVARIRSPVARLDVVIYSELATQSKELDQLRLERHKGLGARSAVARFDEVIYSAQATQPKESDQLRLERHQGLSARRPLACIDEVIYSAQATKPNELDLLRLERHKGLSS